MSAEDFDGIKELAKQNHAERVAKTPDRINYAINQFERYGIKFELKSPQNGHFHAWGADEKLYQFWASTGKILNSNKRGIHNFIRILREGKA